MSAGASMGWAVGLTVAYGLFWGLVVSLLVAVGLAFATGLGVQPDIGAGILAGIAAALCLVFRPQHLRTMPYLLIMVAVVMVAVVAVGFGAPFAVSLDQSPVSQVVALIVLGLGLVWVLHTTLKPLATSEVNRRKIELSMIASMRAFGFVVFTAVVVLPFYVMVMTSLKNEAELVLNPLDFSIDLGQGFSGLFSSYIELFTKYDFGSFLLISAIVSVCTVIVTLLFAVPGAYAVARMRFRGRAAFSRGILMIYMVPAIVLVIPLYAVFSQLGLRNSIIGLLIVYPATTLPVALYMLQGYFRGLPFELEEAGQMDGYKRLAVIWHITLPLSMPALATVSLYVFMIAWNEFLFAFMFLDDTDVFTLSRGIVSLNSSEVPRQHLMAGAVIATVPILIIFLWAERFLVQGLTSGGVKG